jgi:MFS family permease
MIVGHPRRPICCTQYYHYVIVGVTFCILLIGAGVRSTPGILTVRIEEETRWDRGIISGAIALNTLLYGLLGPFVVTIISKFGLRAVVISSLICLGISVSVSSEMASTSTPVLLYVLWGLLVGVGSAGTATVLGAIVADAWFLKRRSVVVGLFAASNAAGSLIFATPVAQVASQFGWRAGVWLMGAAALTLVPLAAFFLFNSPATIGLKRFGEEDEDEGVKRDTAVLDSKAGDHIIPIAPVVVVAAAAAAVASNPFHTVLLAITEGFQNRDFCLLAFSFAVCGASTNGLILTHFVPAATDSGLNEVRAAGMLTAMGALDIVGTIASGLLTEHYDAKILLSLYRLLTEHYDAKILLSLYYAFRGIALSFLPSALHLPSKDSGLWPYAVVYGLDWIATVPPTKRICDELFPGRGSLFFGLCLAVHQIGAAIAAAAGGSVRAHVGTYDHVFWTAAGLCIITAVCVRYIRITTRSVRQ